MSNISNKYHYFYKIINNLNGHFYYGVHNTNDLNDGYMGSGTRLRYAYKKYGIENFTKEILKFFDTSKEAFEYEAEVVNEDLIKDNNCYNIKQGGEGWQTIGLITVRDSNGNCFDVSIHDPRYLSGELKNVNIDKVTICDKNGKFYFVEKNDPRYLSGELKFVLWKYSLNNKSKEKRKQTYKKIKHQQGEKNSQYGTCWIHNDKKSIKIKKEQLEEYIFNGWTKGRKIKF